MTFAFIDAILYGNGELSERFKELVLKTSDSERNLGFESLTLRQKKTDALTQSIGLFQRNKSLRICEIRFACEILLRNVKCLRA